MAIHFSVLSTMCGTVNYLIIMSALVKAITDRVLGYKDSIQEIAGMMLMTCLRNRIVRVGRGSRRVK